MAFATPLFTWRRAIVPVTAGLFATGTILYPKTHLFAEAPEPSSLKKPIYDDVSAITSPSEHKASPSTPSSKTQSPTPTDRLAYQVRRTRLFIYAHVLAAEDTVNSLMDSFLHMESSFTSTIASLAPPKESNERLMPGAIYVLVAAMAGSIVSRNRNILLRSSIPLAVGVGAGWVVLPITMRNIGDFIWSYEQRFPVVADNHSRIRRAAEEGWRQAKSSGLGFANVVDEKIQGGREAAEEWVRKGR
ncbi:MAG: hypothetical protein M1835_006852 [Candelina submexicana]|nr:MAG: hypothetical protein M1835_006852 [Candelina submexicana]